jgi:hypothetical protein
MKKNKRGKAVLPIIVILVILALSGFASYNVFQVKHVLVEGNVEYAAGSIAELANIPDETLMLKVDEAKIKENIESNPFLQLDSVDYELPDTVVLKITERKPIATLRYAGRVLLLDRQLNVLQMDASDESGNYPELQGISPDALNLGKPIQTADSFKITVATSILDELKAQSALAMISVIDLTDINNIRFKTRGGPDVLFGQSDQSQSKIRWMIRILPSLIQEGNTQGIVDVTAGTFATYRQDGGADTLEPDVPDTDAQSGQPEEE